MKYQIKVGNYARDFPWHVYLNGRLECWFENHGAAMTFVEHRIMGYGYTDALQAAKKKEKL